MTHTDERMTNTFGSDPADIRIRSGLIWVQIPDHILALAEYALSGCSRL